MKFNKKCKHELIAELPHHSGDITMVILFENYLDARLAHFKLANLGIGAPLKGMELKLPPLAYKKLFGVYHNE